MATIAEQLIGSALENSTKVPDLSKSLTEGAELGLTVEKVRQSREMMEQKKQELQMQKANSVVDTMKIAAGSKDKRLKDFLLKKVLPAKVNALGMGEFFTPETLEMVQTSEEAQKKVLGLQLDLDEKIRSGEITGAQAYQEAQRILADPEELALLDTDQLFDAQKFKNSEEGKSARNTQMAQAQMTKQQQAQEAAGDVTLRNEVARDHGNYIKGGGSGAYRRAKDIYLDAIKKLREKTVKTGTVGKKFPYGSDEDVLARSDEDAKALVDQIRDGINIRAKSGDPNPTTIQIQQIFNRSIDTRLSNEKNIEKLESEVRRMDEEEKARTRAFRQYGFAVQEEKDNSPEWKAKVKSKKEGYKKLSPQEQNKFVQKLSELLNKTPDEILKELK